jgi:hypothetical protein
MFIASLIFISAHFKIKELGIIPNGSAYSAYFAILSCLFINSSSFTFNIIIKIFGAPVQRAGPLLFARVITLLLLIISLSCILYLLIVGGTLGFPLLNGVDRFDFRIGQSKYIGIILSIKSILAASLGMIRFLIVRRSLNRFLIDGVTVTLLAVALLFGDKFTSVLVFVAFYIGPYLAGSPDTRMFRRLAPLAAAAFVLVGSMTYYIYSDYGNLPSEQTFERLLGRFTGNGQLWYSAMQDRTKFIDYDQSQVDAMKQVIVGGQGLESAVDHRTGVFYLAFRYAPADLVISIIRKSGIVQLTGATEPWLLLCFGHIGMVFSIILLGALAGFLSMYMYISLRYQSIIGYLVGAFILLPFYSMMNQASFYEIFGWKPLMYFTMGIFIDLLTRPFLRRVLN